MKPKVYKLNKKINIFKSALEKIYSDPFIIKQDRINRIMTRSTYLNKKLKRLVFTKRV